MRFNFFFADVKISAIKKVVIVVFESLTKKYNSYFDQSNLVPLIALSGILYSLGFYEYPYSQNANFYIGSRLVVILQKSSVAQDIASTFNRIIYNITNVFQYNQIKYDKNDTCSLDSLKKVQVWKPRTLTSEMALNKMWRNFTKAVNEHRKKEREPYIHLKEFDSSYNMLLSKEAVTPLQFDCTYAEDQGLRSTMEDAWHYYETNDGVLASVFDGHGGSGVSKYVNKEFFHRFYPMLKQNDKNVHQTFEALFNQIHNEVLADSSLNKMGTTATVCYIDKQTNIIYTASIGDSEANVYRRINGSLKSIPLSCVRDWSSVKDARRAALALNDPLIEELWPFSNDAKKLRFPNAKFGVNVSRAIGDKVFTGSEDKPAVIHKPKITVQKVQDNDILIIACDGLKDFASENQILSVIGNKSIKDYAKALKDYALNVGYSTDNITVLAIRIHK
ncbi:MAG: protein serine/threonine phosphatase 2C family protein [Chlamydiae bacterium]|nr:protein serine/threonine phosphatase 2C family protein [Chlamydiota bacterium]